MRAIGLIASAVAVLCGTAAAAATDAADKQWAPFAYMGGGGLVTDLPKGELVRLTSAAAQFSDGSWIAWKEGWTGARISSISAPRPTNEYDTVSPATPSPHPLPSGYGACKAAASESRSLSLWNCEKSKGSLLAGTGPDGRARILRVLDEHYDAVTVLPIMHTDTRLVKLARYDQATKTLKVLALSWPAQSSSR